MPNVRLTLRFVAFLSLFSTSLLNAQPAPPLDTAHFQIALGKLATTGSALYVAAHPDDENTGFLAWLANGRMVRAGYLSLTRGDGGQNLIGSEKGDPLGVIRTEELLAARRIDGAEQFFTRAVDFGYSKNPEESLRLWGKEKILADVVWVIRTFHPDIIVTRFPDNGDGGHGHHTASALLAEEAFTAAADPARFPEQLKYPGVTVWQPRRLFWNSWKPAGSTKNKTVTVDLGTYNPLLGKSYTELAADSRSMHKSQGFGVAERRGSLPNDFELLAGDAPDKDLFDGIDLTWNRVPGASALSQAVHEAARLYRPENPSATMPPLLRAASELTRLRTELRDSQWSNLLEEKQREAQGLIRSAAGLWLEAIATEPAATPGGAVNVTITAVERSAVPVTVTAVRWPFSASSAWPATALEENKPFTVTQKIDIPSTIAATQPYWLARPATGATYSFDQAMTGKPESDPAMVATISIQIGEQKLDYDLPVVFRSTDRVRGEEYRPFAILPPVTIALSQRVDLFPDLKPRAIDGIVRSNATGASGVLSLSLPSGWKSEPATIPLTFKARDEEQRFSFRLTPSSSAGSGTVRAEFQTTGGEKLSQSLTRLDYPHIRSQVLLPPAEAKLVRVEVRKSGSRIGYVMGSGDEVPDALRQMGYSVTMLSDSDLATGDLSRFDSIVVGVRAYNMRDALKRNQRRLMKYVEDGGHVVVQYNTADDTLAPELGPYPLKLSRDRVTVEEAPVTLIDVKNPLVTTPNRITASDFEGWVQERGLYFPSEWATQYQPVFSSHDPGEKELTGGTLVATYGKGTYVYTAYDWFRELPAGVPGAYRIFANLVSPPSAK
ncbi:MAG TPA: PIG-L family deacetylase [Thermoanaerobaculia bacterium]|nr:PIG-L family deacetylase [Thermoanaerobaculia bacterium]